jgi:triacylglycerol lipase
MGETMGVTSSVAQVAVAMRRRSTWTGQLREVASTAVTAGLWPLGLVGSPVVDARTGPGGMDDPVVLLHGFGANRSHWWFLARQLRNAGFTNIHAVNDHPWGAGLHQMAERCAERIEAIGHRHGTGRVHVIGHSLGGVLARYALGVLGLRDVATCITIAAPHGGVPLARLAMLTGGAGIVPVGYQLRPDSAEIALMRASARPSATRFVAYYANLDLVVPARRAMIIEPELNATNLLVADHGHFSMMLSRGLASSIIVQLGDATGGEGPEPDHAAAGDEAAVGLT